MRFPPRPFVVGGESTGGATDLSTTRHRDAAEQDVQDFLDRFAKALTGGDIETVVELW
jgi:hypothetical protein